MGTLYEKIQESARYIRAGIPDEPKIGVVLGTGWQDFTGELGSPTAMKYADVPNLLPVRRSAAKGHGVMVAGKIGEIPVVCLEERFHIYEGFSAQEVVYPVRVLCRLGIKALFVTNAAGGINRRFRVGDLMLIIDHINMTMQNPLIGQEDEKMGTRFIDMTRAYDPALVEVAVKAAGGLGIRLRRGVYAGVSGPSFETPAEIRMLRALGADAVGMSTVAEVVAARQMGVRVCGLSCITNRAAGLGAQEISEEEVHSVMDRVKVRAFKLLRETIVASSGRLGNKPGGHA